MDNNLSRAAVGGIVNEAHVDSLLPEQFFSPRRPSSPEKLLMLAVLQDAWNCIEKHRFACNPAGHRLHREAVNWIAARESRWPYSFESVCAALDINAAAVRQRLRVVSADESVGSPGTCLANGHRYAGPPLGGLDRNLTNENN